MPMIQKSKQKLIKKASHRNQFLTKPICLPAAVFALRVATRCDFPDCCARRLATLSLSSSRETKASHNGTPFFLNQSGHFCRLLSLRCKSKRKRIWKTDLHTGHMPLAGTKNLIGDKLPCLVLACESRALCDANMYLILSPIATTAAIVDATTLITYER